LKQNQLDSRKRNNGINQFYIMGAMVFNATFNDISVISPAFRRSFTNFITWCCEL